MSNYLARRVAALNDAIEAVVVRQDPTEIPLRNELTTELAALGSADALEAKDRSIELGLLAWLLGLPAGVSAGADATLTAVQADAVSHALQQPPALTVMAAEAVMQLRQQKALSLADVPALRAAAQGGFDGLTWAALRQRLALPSEGRPYLYRDVAVLLPLRLETVFEQDLAGWTMLLRIVPDEASIRRDEALPTSFEVESLRSMWQATLEELSPELRALPVEEWLNSPRAGVEWQTLCARFGPERAAGLTAGHLPTLVGNTVTMNPAQLRARASPNRVGGFPRQLEIWVAFGTAAPQRIDTTEVDVDALTFDVVGARPGTDGIAVHEKDRWWISWPVAQSVGLGRVIPLPFGMGPADIRVLYAIGLGEANPEDHFRAQIDAGEMALLPLGAPTNTVDGQQAASLGHDERDWLRVAQRRIRRQADAVTDDQVLSRSLAGSDANLPPLPTSSSLPNIDRLLVGALWPALWGHQMRDLWGCTDAADELSQWARRYLRPEGPLPPIRIAEQAYGLLPTSALSLWRVSPEEGALAALERRLVESLLTLREHWQAAAHSHGTVVGADTAGLLDLIGRDALSASYTFRYFAPVNVWKALYANTTGIDAQRLEAWVRETFAPLHRLLGRTSLEPPGIQEYVAVPDGASELDIPLVTPSQWPRSFYEQDEGGLLRLDSEGKPVLSLSPERALARLFGTIVEFGLDTVVLREKWGGVLPDSLLVRLAIESGLLSAAAVVQADLGISAPLLEPQVANEAEPTRIAVLAGKYFPNPAIAHAEPADTTRRMVVENLERLIKLIADQPPEANALKQLERSFRATLDTATHRIDPWITGMAARRLEYLRSLPQSRFRLGVYGWLDGPMMGEPGPTTGGLLHAASHAQALTAVVLRDKFISEGLESPAPVDGRNLWSMQLESRRVRLAEEIAEEVRLGSHLFEAVGRQVERIMAEGSGPSVAVAALRLTYPMRTTQPDSAAVCNGSDALVGLLEGGAPLVPSAAQRDRLELLRHALDAYGDLLVAEAVHQVVTGHADIAGAAMDAAAGLAAPPTLAFTRTPLKGDGLSTAVLFAIPFHEADADPQPGASPANIADGSVAPAIEQMLGVAEDWTWSRLDDAGAPLAQISLADLRLEPIDTLLLSSDSLEEMVRFRLKAEREEVLGGTGRALQRKARAFVSAIGSQPALLHEVTALDESSEEAAQTRAGDDDILAELRLRYAVLRDAAQQLIDALSAGIIAEDEVALRRHLFSALRWGIRPMLTNAEQRSLWAVLLDAASAPPLALRVAREARDALSVRLASAPAAASREPIARKISELASPEGRLAILSRVERNTLARKSRVDMSKPASGLDETWLPVIAAVRAPLARVEALQLQNLLDEAVPAFVAWSSAPDDPWRTAALANLRQRQTAQPGKVINEGVPRLVVAYTMGKAWEDEGGQLAVSLVDSWSETAPRAEQTTSAAFGFNAPAARPPQAILLAVPPDLDAAFGATLSVSSLVQIVGETRDLAHARAVDAERLGPYLSVVPTLMLPASGATGVRLDPNTSF